MNPYTENLSDFGFREITMLRDLLDAWVKRGLPEDFDKEGVKPAMNTQSGFVFLVNAEYQVAMLNGDNLESFYTTPYEGHEGFLSDLLEEYPDMHADDQEYVREIALNLGREVPQALEA